MKKNIKMRLKSYRSPILEPEKQGSILVWFSHLVENAGFRTMLKGYIGVQGWGNRLVIRTGSVGVNRPGSRGLIGLKSLQLMT